MTPQQATADQATIEVMQHFVANISGLELREKIKQTIIKAMESRAPAPTEPAVDRDSRYRFLLSFLIERGVFHRYHNGVWRLRGIYGVDDSGLKGAGRTVEEALDNAIVAVNLDEQSAEAFWRKSCEAALATPASPAVPEPAPLAPSDDIRDEVAAVMRGTGFDVRPGAGFVEVSGTLDSAAILIEQLLAPAQVDGGKQVCDYCEGASGWGFGEDADGCTACNGTGQAAQKASQPTSAEELQQKEHIPPSRAEPASQLYQTVLQLSDALTAANLLLAWTIISYNLPITKRASSVGEQIEQALRDAGEVMLTSAEGKDSERLEGGAALYAALSALVESLAQSDDEGLIEHAPEMVNARKALSGSVRSPAVPSECTEDMWFATTHIRNDIERADIEAMWRAMIAAAPSSEADPRLDDLSMLVRQLGRALSKAAPSHELPAKAVDYLQRKGLAGSPLRSEPLPPPPEAA